MSMSDLDLWRRLKAGEKSALETIYRSHFDALAVYGLRFSKSKATVEDCIQELFVELFQKRGNLSDVDAIRPYLYVSLRRKLFRSVKNTMSNSQVEVEEHHFDTSISIAEVMISEEINKEQSHQLNQAFQGLSSRQKEILFLKYYSGFDYEEICEIMNMNYQSARNLTSRALNKLSQLLKVVVLYILYGVEFISI